MLSTRVVPILLYKDTGLVKSVKFKDHKYVGDAINAVKIFNEKEVDEIVLLDITTTPNSRKPNLHLIADIASECFMPLGYGGGISEVNEIREILRLGVEKVCINSSAVDNPDLIREAAKLFGNQSIVVSIDAKKKSFGKYEVCTHGGNKATGLDVMVYVRQVEQMGAGEILLNSIDRDGTMQGYDLELLKKVTQVVDIPVVACGGAGKVQDFLDAVSIGGVAAVAAGSMFVFHGRHRAVLISYPPYKELKKAFNEISLR